jgi:hypothetical protein
MARPRQLICRPARTARLTEETLCGSEETLLRIEETEASAARSDRCPTVIHQRPDRTHGRTAETPARTARTRRCIGELDGHPARTDSSPAQSYPTSARTSGPSPRIDHGTAATESCIAGTFLVFARTDGCTDGILRRTAQINRRRARMDRCTGWIQAHRARICLLLAGMYSAPAGSIGVPQRRTGVAHECAGALGE